MVKDPDNRTTRWLRKIPFAHGWEKPLKKECLLRAERMLRLVRIPDPKNVIHSFPHELSGGMQQRVMIAMALACKPQVLIADEPTTALDVTIQAQILKLLKELQEETGTSILLITHNLGVVAETCDRLGVMYAGTIAEIGSKLDVFKEPLHPYTQGLLNSIPRMNVEMTRLETIEGNVPNLVKPPPGCRFHPRCPFAMEVCKSVKPPMQEIRPNHFAACHLYGEVNLHG
jgi:peptide/nickel transport system ATP-binding protein